MPHSPTERFGMVVFASQRDRPPYSIFKTHTFAAFVDHGTSSIPPSQVIISWLPADGRVGLGLFPEPGKPFSLQDSFDWTFGVGPYEGGMALSAWHAVAIKEELFDSAKHRVQQMAADRYQYYFFGMQEFRRAVNCTHALSNLDLVPRHLLDPVHPGEAIRESPPGRVLPPTRPLDPGRGGVEGFAATRPRGLSSRVVNS